MNARQFVLLILLNVAMIAAVARYFQKHLEGETPATPRVVATLPAPFPKARPVAAPQPPSPAQTVFVTNQFHWSDVESSDYREYIANLRAIGCPEVTIKDIILTDVLKLYSARRGQFYHNGREFRFWETDEKRKLNARQLEEREKQLAIIDKEIPAVLRDLLGINYEREMNKYFVDANEDERRLTFLPEDKRARVLELREQFEGMRERALHGADARDPQVQAALRSIEAQRSSALEELLAPEELIELDLRTSPAADRLRSELVGFNPTEEEFRRLYEIRLGLASRDGSGPSELQGAEVLAQFHHGVHELLGEARYADFVRSQNADFREASVFAEVYELPPSAAQTLFDIKQIAEEEREKLLNYPGVGAQELREALAAIQQETENSLRETLGANVFARYTQSSGKWVRNLAQAR